MKLLGIGSKILDSIVSSIQKRDGVYVVVLSDGRAMSLSDVEKLLNV
jgi:hypothetical protein